MTNWRKRIGEDGLEELLKEILSTAIKLGFIKLSEFKKVNVDTTVQEKYTASQKLRERRQRQLMPKLAFFF